MTNEELVVQIQSGVSITENMYQLYEQNKGMIYKTAKRFVWGAPLEDLTQEAYIALCKAVKNYSVKQEYKFTTYYMMTLSRHFKRYIENSGRVIRVPVHKQEQIWKYNQVSSAYLHRFGREPTTQEYAACMGLRVSQIEELEQFMFGGSGSEAKSLDQQLTGADDMNLSDVIAVECKDIDGVLDKLAYEQMWQQIKEYLGFQQYNILRMRYRLGMTQQAIGEKLGCNRQAVSDREYRALYKLSHTAFMKEYAELAGINHR